ncbi:hypothetical protein HN51_057672 [Arachis hypogaea]
MQLIFWFERVRVSFFCYLTSCYFMGVQFDGAIKEAFDVAYNNIYAFHAAQKTPERIVENMKVCMPFQFLFLLWIIHILLSQFF